MPIIAVWVALLVLLLTWEFVVSTPPQPMDVTCRSRGASMGLGYGRAALLLVLGLRRLARLRPLHGSGMTAGLAAGGGVSLWPWGDVRRVARSTRHSHDGDRQPGELLGSGGPRSGVLRRGVRGGPPTAGPLAALGGQVHRDRPRRRCLSYIAAELANGTWSATTSLPLALCNVGVVVAAIRVLVASTAPRRDSPTSGIGRYPSAVLTLTSMRASHTSSSSNICWPPRYRAGCAVPGRRDGHRAEARLRAAGLRHHPRVHRVRRLVDWLIGANYMFLARPPGEWTVLRLLGRGPGTC